MSDTSLKGPAKIGDCGCLSPRATWCGQEADARHLTEREATSFSGVDRGPGSPVQLQHHRGPVWVRSFTPQRLHGWSCGS